MAIPLSLQNYARLPESVLRPTYERRELSPGIVHVGIGNFHRAHQALYLSELFELGRDRDWAIVGAGVRPADARMRERLAAQDWLTTVVELAPAAKRAQICASMIDFMPPDPQNAPLIAELAKPSTRIVSLTVTEGGYYLHPAQGVFDAEHPEMLADAARADCPGSVFGAIIAGLERRRAAGRPPFTVMSCDNLPHNGDVARDTVAGLAALRDAPLADWIRAEVAFPNSMVDRITPATTDRERELLRDHFGVEDACVVVCEPFRQWVLEDHFPAGRPAFEEVGVTLSSQVAAYETMKIRMLNGGHAAIAYPAALLGIRFVHEAMAEPLIRGFLEKLEQEEILPIVPPVPNTDLREYLQLIVERFANPDIGDTIPRLCIDGSNRQPKFIVPSVQDRLKQGLSIPGLALVSALWCRYCQGFTDAGDALALDDLRAERLRTHAEAAKENPVRFLEMSEVYGELAHSQVFRKAFATQLQALQDRQTAAVLRAYLGG